MPATRIDLRVIGRPIQFTVTRDELSERMINEAGRLRERATRETTQRARQMLEQRADDLRFLAAHLPDVETFKLTESQLKAYGFIGGR